MDNKNKNLIQKYTGLYMSIGMCFGSAFGLTFGNLLFPDNMMLGMTFGIPIGMCLGLCLGSAKDARLSKNILKISEIEPINEDKKIAIHTVNSSNEEKIIYVTSEQLDQEQFSVGDRVAVDDDGSLVPLEDK